MKTGTLHGLAIAAAFLAAPAWAQDAARGRLLYENHCLACHYERIHKRDPAKSLVKSFLRLRVEVADRAALTQQRFTIQDLDDIAEYLNRSHYRFGASAPDGAPAASSAPSPGK
jgi:mono/diheme cytochrome c family protein